MEHVHGVIAWPSAQGVLPWWGGGYWDGRAGFHLLCTLRTVVLVTSVRMTFMHFVTVCYQTHGVPQFGIVVTVMLIIAP